MVVIKTSAASLFFPSIMDEYKNQAIYRSWADPKMSLYYLYPFVFGIVAAWAWSKVKTAIPGQGLVRGAKFGIGYWILASIPGMFITYSSFQVSLVITFDWLIGGLINGLVAGWIFSKMDK